MTIPHYFKTIQGFFNYGDFYRRMVTKFDSGLFVEIGVWRGRSTAFLAVEIANSGKPILLDCVDHFRGSERERDTYHRAARKEDIETVAAENLRQFWETAENRCHTTRVDNLLKIVPLNSRQAAQKYSDGSITFCFIDAGHTEREVAEDIQNWLPKVRPGGILAGHDYCDQWPGVARAVDRLLPHRKQASKSCWLAHVT